jgi:small conductance mechanosensitive channel
MRILHRRLASALLYKTQNRRKGYIRAVAFDILQASKKGMIQGAELKTATFMDELVRTVAHFAPKAAASAFIFIGFWLVSIFVRRLIKSLDAHIDEHKRVVIDLCGQVVYIGILVFGAITSLGTLGVNVSALVAGLGLTGFALGYAFKDALSNLLAGVMILLHRPFQYHDHISVAGLEGTVINIDFRYTTLQTEDKIYLVPNSTLLTTPIIISHH